MGGWTVFFPRFTASADLPGLAEREGGVSESVPETEVGPELLEEGEEGEQEPQEDEDEVDGVEMQPMRLLLVEEDTVMLKEVGDMLRFTGHHVTKTGFGPQLLHVMCEAQWDGMLIGIGKANGYGWDLLKGYRMWQQRQDEASSDICLLIPKGDSVAQECAQRWGACSCEKPLSVSALVGTCRQLLNAKMAKLSIVNDSPVSTNGQAHRAVRNAPPQQSFGATATEVGLSDADAFVALSGDEFHESFNSNCSAEMNSEGSRDAIKRAASLENIVQVH